MTLLRVVVCRHAQNERHRLLIWPLRRIRRCALLTVASLILLFALRELGIAASNENYIEAIIVKMTTSLLTTGLSQRRNVV